MISLTNQTCEFTNRRSSMMAALVCLSFFWIINAQPIIADVVWVQGQANPISGLIDSIDSDVIHIRIYENGNLGQPQPLERTNVEQFVINIDPLRLANLSPDRPREYRDYGEELASQKLDPMARAFARRLLLIAAAQSNKLNDKSGDKIQSSALALLSTLAESPSERKKIEMLRFMIDPDSAKRNSTLQTSIGIIQSSEQKQLMLDLVQALRQENSETATALLSSDENREVFALWGDTCSVEELDEIAKVNRPSKSQLGKILRIELEIISSGSDGPDAIASSLPMRKKQGWGDFATQASEDLRVVPSFENVTNLDPAESIYRDGNWIRPGDND